MMPSATAAVRLPMLTGCRKSEILILRWSEVDLDAAEIHLADAKPGPREPRPGWRTVSATLVLRGHWPWARA